MSDTDLAMATVLISEAILKLGVEPAISHTDLKESLRGVLAENHTAIRLVAVPAVADAAMGPRRGAGLIADATQPRIRRGSA